MSSFPNLQGVFAAAVTPLGSEYSPDPAAMLDLLDFLGQRGCHGALLFGTTGEGPSFSPQERYMMMQSAMAIHQTHANFRLLAGTGTPSLDETVSLTKRAFDLGYDGVVVLPPYYYRDAPEDGLFEWFSQVVRRAVPRQGAFLAYHIPRFSGISLSMELLRRLKDTFPNQFAGLKDSSGDKDHARHLGSVFGNDLVVLTGSDSLFSTALESHASGCITALSNLSSPLSRQIWDSHIQGKANPIAQSRLDEKRKILDAFPPIPSFVKVILTHHFRFPNWRVRPPLLSLTEDTAARAAADWAHAEDE